MNYVVVLALAAPLLVFLVMAASILGLFSSKNHFPVDGRVRI